MKIYNNYFFKNVKKQVDLQSSSIQFKNLAFSFSFFDRILFVIFFVFFHFSKLTNHRNEHFLLRKVSTGNPYLFHLKCYVIKFYYLLKIFDLHDFLVRIATFRNKHIKKNNCLITSEFNTILDYFVLLRFFDDVDVYIYSWDHPQKISFYSNKFNYLVWNEPMKEDLFFFGNCNGKSLKVKIVGSTIFNYLDKHSNKFINNNANEEYDYYFLFTFNNANLSFQELYYLNKFFILNNVVNKNILIRLYPGQSDVLSLTHELEFANNNKVSFEDSYLTPDSKKQIFISAQNSAKILHFCTTSALEIQYLGGHDVVSLMTVDNLFEKDKFLYDLSTALNQHHVVKYIKCENPEIIFFDSNRYCINEILQI